MQIKTTVYHHCYPSYEQSLKIKQYQVMDRVCEGVKIFPHFWWECKIVKLFWKSIWHHLVKLNICNILITCDLLIPLLHIYLRQLFFHMCQKSGFEIIYWGLVLKQKINTIQMSISNGKIGNYCIFLKWSKTKYIKLLK